MNDLERLRQWMAQRDLNTPAMAREMGMSRHSLYANLEMRKGATYALVAAFTRRYGADEARTIFQEFYAPLEVA